MRRVRWRRSLGDQRRLGWALGYLAVHHIILGEHVRAIEAARSARAIGEVVEDIGMRVVANFYLGQALWFAGDPRRAADALRAATTLLKGVPLSERFGLAALPAVVARYVLAAVLADLGEFAEALPAGEEGLRIAQTAGHAYSEVWARWGLGYAHLRHGDFAEASRMLEQGLTLCRATESRLALPYVAANLGSAYLWSGRAADAGPLLEEAVEAITAMRILAHRSWVITFLAEACLVLGRIAEARERAEQAVALARAQQERGWEAWGLKLLGDVHARASAKIGQGGGRAGRGRVPAGSRARYRTGHAPARRPLSLRPRQALSTDEQPRGSTRTPHDRHHDVPRDGHAILAGAGAGGNERAGLTRSGYHDVNSLSLGRATDAQASDVVLAG